MGGTRPSLRTITWKHFVHLCVLEELVSAGPATPLELFDRLDATKYRVLLGRYGLLLGECKEMISPREVVDAVCELIRARQVVPTDDDHVQLTALGVSAIPDIVKLTC